MLKFKSLPILASASAIALLVGMSCINPASATIMSLGPGSPIDASGSGISGLGTLHLLSDSCDDG